MPAAEGEKDGLVLLPLVRLGGPEVGDSIEVSDAAPGVALLPPLALAEGVPRRGVGLGEGLSPTEALMSAVGEREGVAVEGAEALTAALPEAKSASDAVSCGVLESAGDAVPVAQGEALGTRVGVTLVLPKLAVGEAEMLGEWVPVVEALCAPLAVTLPAALAEPPALALAGPAVAEPPNGDALAAALVLAARAVADTADEPVGGAGESVAKGLEGEALPVSDTVGLCVDEEAGLSLARREKVGEEVLPALGEAAGVKDGVLLAVPGRGEGVKAFVPLPLPLAPTLALPPPGVPLTLCVLQPEVVAVPPTPAVALPGAVALTLEVSAGVCVADVAVLAEPDAREEEEGVPSPGEVLAVGVTSGVAVPMGAESVGEVLVDTDPAAPLADTVGEPVPPTVALLHTLGLPAALADAVPPALPVRENDAVAPTEPLGEGVPSSDCVAAAVAEGVA